MVEDLENCKWLKIVEDLENCKWLKIAEDLKIVNG